MTGDPARLLLSGYYGFGNFGDEAILRVFVDQWRARRPDDTITVLSGNPMQTASAYGVEAMPRLNPRDVADAIKRSHIVVSGGGGLLQNATSLRSLLYYTGIIREAKRAGRKAAIFAQGVGPLDFIGKQVVKRTCGDVDMAIVRDDDSAALLQPLVPRVPVEVAADPVFLTPTAIAPESVAALGREGVTKVEGDLVTVVVRKSPLLDRIAGELAAGIDRLSSAHGAHVVFVPLQRPDDAEAAIDVIRRCKTAPTLLGGGYDMPTMSALFARSAAVVSMRLHALILAARLAVPMLAIPYDPKVTALLRMLSYPLPALERGTAGAKLFDQLWEDRASLAAHLASVVEPVVRRATTGFDRLAQLAEGAVAEALK
jgi:polysaccharide pyruvyl transferase CsaB